MRRRKTCKLAEETFASLALAKKAVEEEETWSWKAKKVEKNINKHYYRCNKVGQSCPRQSLTELVLILKGGITRSRTS